MSKIEDSITHLTQTVEFHAYRGSTIKVSGYDDGSAYITVSDCINGTPSAALVSREGLLKLATLFNEIADS